MKGAGIGINKNESVNESALRCLQLEQELYFMRLSCSRTTEPRCKTACVSIKGYVLRAMRMQKKRLKCGAKSERVLERGCKQRKEHIRIVRL